MTAGATSSAGSLAESATQIVAEGAKNLADDAVDTVKDVGKQALSIVTSFF